MRRLILSCMIGNALEWYDFVIYGYFATIIGALFFPESDELSRIMMTFGIFAAGFIARPLGAIVFGHIGDRVSRKKALLLSIYVMAIPTFLIGCIPTHEQIGILAPILLMILKIVQGFAIGGEFTGSMVFMVESSPRGKTGLIGSCSTFSCVMGVIIGSAISLFFTNILPSDDLMSWGWRIPFLLSILGSIVGSYMRRTLVDPKIYADHKDTLKTRSMPLAELFTKHLEKMLIVFFIDCITAVGFFLVVVFLPTYLQNPQMVGLEPSIALIINTACMVLFAFSTLIGGWLFDIYRGKKVLMFAALIFIATSYPLFHLFKTGSTALIFCSEAILCVTMGLFFGAIPATLCEIFPTRVRFSGLSISHNLSMAIFGGTAPLFATYLLQSTGDLASPSYLLVGAAIVCIAALSRNYGFNCVEIKPAESKL